MGHVRVGEPRPPAARRVSSAQRPFTHKGKIEVPMTRLEKLKVLEADLRAALDDADFHNTAQLARQYRETLREIEQLEKDTDEIDEIAAILARRKPDAD